MGAPTRKRTRPTRAETRQRLLDAALEVFGERGIAGATVSDVAAAAGMTKGAVYSNFAGKDQLVLAMMETHVGERARDALAALDAAPDFDTAVRDVGVVLVDAIRTDASWHRLLAEYFVLSHNDPALREGLRRRRRETRETVAATLSELFDRLELEPPMAIDELTLALIALSNGLGIESGIDPDALTDDVFSRVLALVLRDALDEMRGRGT